MTVLDLPPIVKREEWARRTVVRTPLPTQPATGVVVHHAVSAIEGSTIDVDNDGLPESFEEILREIEDFHLDVRRWRGGIAYSLLVGHRAGRKAEGRGWGLQSGATGDPDDRVTVSICAVGNYHDVHDVTDELIRNIAETIAEGITLGHLVPLDQLRIYGHQDKPFATACPGQRLMARLGEVRPLVAQILEGDQMASRDDLEQLRKRYNDGDRDAVRFVQGLLDEAARLTSNPELNPGNVDGRLGPRTRRALAVAGVQGDVERIGPKGWGMLLALGFGHTCPDRVPSSAEITRLTEQVAQLTARATQAEDLARVLGTRLETKDQLINKVGEFAAKAADA